IARRCSVRDRRRQPRLSGRFLLVATAQGMGNPGRSRDRLRGANSRLKSAPPPKREIDGDGAARRTIPRGKSATLAGCLGPRFYTKAPLSRFSGASASSFFFFFHGPIVRDEVQ